MAHNFANDPATVAAVGGGGSMPESVANAHAFHAEAYRRASVRGGGIAEVAKDDSDGGDDDSPIAAAGQFVASGLNVISSGINAISRIGAAAEDASLSNAGGPEEVTMRGDVPLTGELATASGITGSSITATDPVAKPSTKNENSGSIGLGSRAAFGVGEITRGSR